MVGMMLTKALYALPTWTRTARLVREHSELRSVLGSEAPSEWACYRFARKLREHSEALADCLDRVIASLHERLPEYGRDVAIDGSDLPAYANGQRFLSKHGPEREKYSDPDASWGHRSAVSTRKGGGYYGYKIHAAVCTATDLPLAWTTETAKDSEQTFALGLLDTAKARGFAVRTAIMDKGYDVGPIHDGCMDRGVCPVTSLKESSRTERGEHKPPCCRHGVWIFAGADFKRRASKWRCPSGRVPARERVGQGRSPAPADPARIRAVAQALPLTRSRGTRVRQAQARMGVAPAPRPWIGSRSATCRLDDPREARLRTREGACRTARGIAEAADRLPRMAELASNILS
jgi:Transposase DDE domain